MQGDWYIGYEEPSIGHRYEKFQKKDYEQCAKHKQGGGHVQQPLHSHFSAARI